MYKIEIKDYSFSYPGMAVKALQNINLLIDDGDFILLCGRSGSGKTTLLRSLKREVSPAGNVFGDIYIDGKKLDELTDRESAEKMGFVFQDPENQIVTDMVRHELAFGLENLGTEPKTLRRRVAETANFFGIDSWFNKKISELSGGQKQILNLAAVTVMQPEIILLDEPTSQLDPIAAKDFLNMLSRLNKELGITVILCEHRLDDVLSMVSKVAYLDDGKVISFMPADVFAEDVMNRDADLADAMPASVKIAHKLGFKDCPLSVRECRHILKNNGGLTAKPHNERELKERQILISANDICFRYSKDSSFVLTGASIDICASEIHAVVGGNGSGKSTLMKILSGVLSASRGRIKKTSASLRAAMLMQNPKSLFVCDTVYDELNEWSGKFNYTEDDIKKEAERFGITYLFFRHPYDISGGEMQKLALAKLLLTRPDIILLDEPTKGIDIHYKKEIASYLTELKNSGCAVVLVTHDLDFAAETADKCSFLFNGEIVCTEEAKKFFAGNSYYTTSVNRIARGFADNCVVPEDILCD